MMHRLLRRRQPGATDVPDAAATPGPNPFDLPMSPELDPTISSSSTLGHPAVSEAAHASAASGQVPRAQQPCRPATLLGSPRAMMAPSEPIERMVARASRRSSSGSFELLESGPPSPTSSMSVISLRDVMEQMATHATADDEAAGHAREDVPAGLVLDTISSLGNSRGVSPASSRDASIDGGSTAAADAILQGTLVAPPSPVVTTTTVVATVAAAGMKPLSVASSAGSQTPTEGGQPELQVQASSVVGADLAAATEAAEVAEAMSAAAEAAPAARMADALPPRLPRPRSSPALGMRLWGRAARLVGMDPSGACGAAHEEPSNHIDAGRDAAPAGAKADEKGEQEEEDEDLVDVAALRLERDELACKLLETDAALAAEQALRRSAAAEAAAQRALVMQLLAAQEELQLHEPPAAPEAAAAAAAASAPAAHLGTGSRGQRAMALAAMVSARSAEAAEAFGSSIASSWAAAWQEYNKQASTTDGGRLRANVQGGGEGWRTAVLQAIMVMVAMLCRVGRMVVGVGAKAARSASAMCSRWTRHGLGRTLSGGRPGQTGASAECCARARAQAAQAARAKLYLLLWSLWLALMVFALVLAVKEARGTKASLATPMLTKGQMSGNQSGAGGVVGSMAASASIFGKQLLLQQQQHAGSVMSAAASNALVQGNTHLVAMSSNSTALAGQEQEQACSGGSSGSERECASCPSLPQLFAIALEASPPAGDNVPQQQQQQQHGSSTRSTGCKAPRQLYPAALPAVALPAQSEVVLDPIAPNPPVLPSLRQQQQLGATAAAHAPAAGSGAPHNTTTAPAALSLDQQPLMVERVGRCSCSSRSGRSCVCDASTASPHGRALDMGDWVAAPLALPPRYAGMTYQDYVHLTRVRARTQALLSQLPRPAAPAAPLHAALPAATAPAAAPALSAAAAPAALGPAAATPAMHLPASSHKPALPVPAPTTALPCLPTLPQLPAVRPDAGQLQPSVPLASKQLQLASQLLRGLLAHLPSPNHRPAFLKPRWLQSSTSEPSLGMSPSTTTSSSCMLTTNTSRPGTRALLALPAPVGQRMAQLAAKAATAAAGVRKVVRAAKTKAIRLGPFRTWACFDLRAGIQRSSHWAVNASAGVPHAAPATARCCGGSSKWLAARSIHTAVKGWLAVKQQAAAGILGCNSSTPRPATAALSTGHAWRAGLPAAASPAGLPPGGNALAGLPPAALAPPGLPAGKGTLQMLSGPAPKAISAASHAIPLPPAATASAAPGAKPLDRASQQQQQQQQPQQEPWQSKKQRQSQQGPAQHAVGAGLSEGALPDQPQQQLPQEHARAAHGTDQQQKQEKKQEPKKQEKKQGAPSGSAKPKAGANKQQQQQQQQDERGSKGLTLRTLQRRATHHEVKLRKLAKKAQQPLQQCLEALPAASASVGGVHSGVVLQQLLQALQDVRAQCGVSLEVALRQAVTGQEGMTRAAQQLAKVVPGMDPQGLCRNSSSQRAALSRKACRATATETTAAWQAAGEQLACVLQEAMPPHQPGASQPRGSAGKQRRGRSRQSHKDKCLGAAHKQLVHAVQASSRSLTRAETAMEALLRVAGACDAALTRMQAAVAALDHMHHAGMEQLAHELDVQQELVRSWEGLGMWGLEQEYLDGMYKQVKRRYRRAALACTHVGTSPMQAHAEALQQTVHVAAKEAQLLHRTAHEFNARSARALKLLA